MDDFDFEIEESESTDSVKKEPKKGKKDKKDKKDSKEKKDKKDKKGNKGSKDKKLEKEKKSNKGKKSNKESIHKEKISEDVMESNEKRVIGQPRIENDQVVMEAQEDSQLAHDVAQIMDSDIIDSSVDFEEDEFQLIEEDEEHVRGKSKERKKKMVKLVIVAIIVLVVCSVGCFTFIQKSAELDRFETVLLDGQYKKAKKIYIGLMDSQLATADSMIATKAKTIYQKYYKKTIDLDKAVNELKELDKVSINDVVEIDDMITLFSRIKASEKNYDNAVAKDGEGKLVEAIKLYRAVIKYDCHYKEAQVAIKKTCDKYRELMIEQAEIFAEDEDYDSAIKTMNKAMESLIDDEKALKQLQTYKSAKLSLEISDINDTVDVQVKNKKYVNAIKVVYNAIGTYGEDIRLLEMLASLQESMYKEIDSYIESERYTIAIAMLKSYVRIIDEDDKAKSLIEQYSSKIEKGHYISNMTPIASEGKFYKISDVADYKDMQGNKYETVIEVVGYKNLDKAGSFTVENKTYKKLTGILGYISDEDMEYYKNGKGVLKIYGDDKQLYKSPIISSTSDNVEIAVDISGYKQIKVKWENADSKNGDAYGIVLGDLMVN